MRTKNTATKIIISLLPLLLPLATHAALENPLGTTDVYMFIGRLVRALLGLSGAAALLMFVWGGFLWLTSRGEPAQVTKGKDTLKWATLGLAIIFTAFTLVSAIITGLTSGSVIDTSAGGGGAAPSECPPGQQVGSYDENGVASCIPN